MEANYTGELYLEKMGTDLGFSAKYMSKIFKQKTGENLTDYINRVRMEKAREILLSTNIKINDVAVMVGIESRATFLRVFKKLEGISPGEYRKVSRQREEEKNHADIESNTGVRDGGGAGL